ncbi:MAG TPA: hypothetical protein VFV67_08400 [Actinophytocola sp.]|uniref:hypothetical protein n=1 Tax=Actinophytocola sp. TaxID=1872138 RepID=UPI002DBC7462|nr:hypothetical protein [Actinophytocola sp.]HEU5470660.1 hypothetical protein [Actinophytocola sp.]
MRHRTVAGRLLLALCGLVFTMTGCSTDPAAPGQGQPDGPDAKQPFDIVRSEQVGLIDHAQQRIRNTCLADAGYPHDRDHHLARPQDPFGFLTVSARDFGPTSEDEARRTGFGRDFGGEPARVVSTDPNYDAASERCAQLAWDRLGPAAREVRTAYSDLVNALAPYRRDVDAELPADLPGKLMNCMAGRGYAVPDQDAFRKTPSHRLFGIAYGHLETGAEETWEPVRRPGTVEVGPAIPPRRYIPTPAESELAVAWFHCGRETGRVDAQLAGVQRVQARYVEKYRTWIDELNPKVEEMARHAAGIASGS